MPVTFIKASDMVRWRRWDADFFVRMKELEPTMNRILEEWTEEQIRTRVEKLPNRVFPDLQFMARGKTGKYNRATVERAPLHEQALALAAALDSTARYMAKLRQEQLELEKELDEIQHFRGLKRNLPKQEP